MMCYLCKSHWFDLYVFLAASLNVQLRLVNGSDANSGRVEVKRPGGQWGTICDDGWGVAEATVVCNALHKPTWVYLEIGPQG